MKHPDYRALKTIMDCLDQSPKLLRLAWALIGVAFLFAASSLIAAIRWW